MKVFFDTSSLLKKYVVEPGYEELEVILAKTKRIVVSPTFLLEAHSAIERGFREGKILAQERTLLKGSIRHDFSSFEQISFDHSMRDHALDLIERYPLTALDGIQLASALITQADLFVTSDKKLFKCAQKELKKVELI